MQADNFPSKSSGLQNEKFTDEIIGLITDARKNGVKVLCDQYQSNKGSTTLAQLISPEFQADGIKGLLAHLKNPHSRQKIIECLKNDVSYENYLHNLGPEQIIIVANQAFEAFDGKKPEGNCRSHESFCGRNCLPVAGKKMTAMSLWPLQCAGSRLSTKSLSCRSLP